MHISHLYRGVLFAFAALCLGGIALANGGTTTQHSIATLIARDGRFTTLNRALQTSGLNTVLQDDGPYTVFAPTDAAFAKLPAGTVQTWINNREQLTDVLLYHVAPGRIVARDLVRLTRLGTLEGNPVAITTVAPATGVAVNEVSVVTANIMASNGVIHVIDTVMLPPAAGQGLPALPGQDPIVLLTADGRFTTLLRAIDAAGLTSFFRQTAPVTFFAPTNAAFAKLPERTVTALMSNPARLRQILLYHLVPGNLPAATVTSSRTLDTFLGIPLTVTATGGTTRLNNTALFTTTNLAVATGTIHAIDTVLIPPQ